MQCDFTEKVINRTEKFVEKLNHIRFSFNGFIYNPLTYAWNNHVQYLSEYVKEHADNLFLGMNPGPYGMAQTGIPFGEINFVKNYLKISGSVGKPEIEHPAKPVLGMKTERSEISGKRFWSLIRSKYEDPTEFPPNNAILNYCPLCFIENTKSGKNVTPDLLSVTDRLSVSEVCNAYLSDMINLIKPKKLIGIGRYAYNKLREISDLPVYYMNHPSPLNPSSNNDWVKNQYIFLTENGIWT